MACLVKMKVLATSAPQTLETLNLKKKVLATSAPQTLETLNLEHSKNPSTLFYKKRKLMITAKFSEIDHSVFKDDSKAPASDRQVKSPKKPL